MNRAAIGASIEEIRIQSERASRIIERVRSFVRKTEPHHSLEKINHLVREALRLVESDLEVHRITVQTDLDPDDPGAEMDGVLIEQVVLNLLRNAWEAMVVADSETRRILLGTRRLPGGDTEVTVADTGPGMSPAVAQEAFRAFFTTKENGLGMGLAISRSIIDVHRGTLWGERNPEGGMTFHFVLPALEESRR
jgi:two-component system sensor kinase FixL